ncbi:nucleotidyltransferase family protein [bacterium]|nr:MAG: nucleotidyltransferase family protein [bacterium]
MNVYEELLVLLVKNEIKFITVGGFACAFNGYIRPTQDVDILVEHNEENISKIGSSLSV